MSNDLSDLSRPVAFQLHGQLFRINGAEVLRRVREAIAQGLPPEAHDYRRWAVEVDGYLLNLKWVFQLATGVPRSSFDSPTARKLLSRLGVESIPVDAESGEKRAEEPMRRTAAERDRFFLAVVELALAALASIEIPAPKIGFKSGRSYVQLSFPRHPGLGHQHYEIAEHRDTYEIGLHFESSWELNMRRMEAFLPYLEQISQVVGRTVRAEPWGRRWARVWCELEPGEVDYSEPEPYAAILVEFMQATYPILSETHVSSTFSTTRRSRESVARPQEDNESYAILDREVSTIRQFVNGRSDRPSDEKLCDWIHFCYTFEFFDEAIRLFQVVDPGQVNPWYYERTKRLARICTLRSQS